MHNFGLRFADASELSGRIFRRHSTDAFRWTTRHFPVRLSISGWSWADQNRVLDAKMFMNYMLFVQVVQYYLQQYLKVSPAIQVRWARRTAKCFQLPFCFFASASIQTGQTRSSTKTCSTLIRCICEILWIFTIGFDIYLLKVWNLCYIKCCHISH